MSDEKDPKCDYIYALVNSLSHAILHIAMRCDNVAISALVEVRIEWLRGLFTDGEVRAGMGMLKHSEPVGVFPISNIMSKWISHSSHLLIEGLGGGTVKSLHLLSACHLFLIFSASVRSIPFLSFFRTVFCMKYTLDFPLFSWRDLSFRF